MGKFNEIQGQMTQSWGGNSFTTTVKDDTVEFDSSKDKFTFKDPIEVPSITIGGTESVPFSTEDKTKLDNLQTPMQIKGRVDSIGDLPTEGVVVGDTYLVGQSGNQTFDEYVCTGFAGTPEAPVWESVGSTQVQTDWNQNDSTKADYIKNRTHYVEVSGGEETVHQLDDKFIPDSVARTTDLPTSTSDLTNDSGFITKDVNDLTNYTKTSDLATVATSGDYDDLTDKPFIPTMQQVETSGTEIAKFWTGNGASDYTSIYAPAGGGSSVQSDWNQNDSSAADYVKNRTHYSYTPDNVYTGGSPNTVTCTKQAWALQWSNNQNLLSDCQVFDGDGSYYALGIQLYDASDNLIFDAIEDVLNNASGSQLNDLYSQYPQSWSGQPRQYMDAKILLGYFGNNLLFVISGVNTTNEPWTIKGISNIVWNPYIDIGDYHYALFETGTYTVKLRALARDEVVHKLDSKYIDIDIPVIPSTAAGTGTNAVIEGYVTPVQGEEWAINTATGINSHAGGYNSHATGGRSFSHGSGVTASGNMSVSLCSGNFAAGQCAVAIGLQNTASHNQSVAMGVGNTANGANMLKFGKYSITESPSPSKGSEGTYVEVVGNGTGTSARSNARTLDWSGNETLAGNLTIGGASGATLRVDNGSLQVSFDGGASWLTIQAS